MAYDAMIYIACFLCILALTLATQCPAYDISQNFASAEIITARNDASLTRMNDALDQCIFGSGIPVNKGTYCFGHCQLRSKCLAVNFSTGTILCSFCLKSTERIENLESNLTNVYLRSDAIEDDCAHNPCTNGGTCTDVVLGYLCECEEGFTGMHCEVDIDECASTPCQNGGSCNDLHGGYQCDCQPDFLAENCHITLVEKICLDGPTPAEGVVLNVSSEYPDNNSCQICLNSNVAWATSTTNRDSLEFVEVDMGSIQNIRQIVTKGNGNQNLNEWILQYELQIMQETSYQSLGSFVGNSDRNTAVYNNLAEPVRTRKVKLVPLEWHYWRSLRLGIMVEEPPP